MGNIIGGLIGVAVVILTSTQQNGNSILGLLTTPFQPLFLTNNPLPGGTPWGNLSSSTNYYQTTPNTGVTRSYDFTVTRGVISPDGVQKNVILTNGAFPGPTITANWGDMISVTVHNQISNPDEGIGFHWHGILQKKTQYLDGVAGVTQCPIPPGGSFTYTFQADLYGSTWYHSHYSAQYAGGLIGPMIIFGPTQMSYDLDVGPVMLSDWYHANYSDVVAGLFDTNFDLEKFAPASQSNLINGKNTFDCSKALAGQVCVAGASLAKFNFKRGKVHRLRLINSGAEALQRFSIDGHTMTVIANDFVPVVPYNTSVVTLGIGQRTDVLVTANQASTSSWYMRSTASVACSRTQNPSALAAIYYDNADTTTNPTSTGWTVLDSLDLCKNDDLTKTVPYVPQPAIQPVDFVQNIDIGFAPNASNMLLWSMNGQTFRANYNAPILLLANKGNFTYDPEWNVYNYGTNKSMTFVINNPVGYPAHPMHMHGHNFMVLHVGFGAWDGTITNPQNPQRRDVQMLPGGSHIVLQIAADNPGAWPLHCHIAWHVSTGLYITILERPDLVQKISIPATSAQLCRDWGAYTGNHIPDQIDSGL